MAVERARRERGVRGEVVDADPVGEPFARPFEQRAEPRVVGDRPVDVLRLAARAVQRHHQPARDGGRDLRPVVGRDQREAQVDPRGRAGRGVDVAVADVQRVGVDLGRAGSGVGAPPRSAQWVVARRPSSSPAWPSTKAPVQSETIRGARRRRRAQFGLTAAARGPTSPGRSRCRRPRGRRARRACRWRSPSGCAPASSPRRPAGTRTRDRRCPSGRARRPHTGSRGRRSARPGRSPPRRCACPKASDSRLRASHRRETIRRMRRWLLLVVLLVGCGEEPRPVVEGRLAGRERVADVQGGRRLLADDGARTVRRRDLGRVQGGVARRQLRRRADRARRPADRSARRLRRAVGAGRQQHPVPARGRAGRIHARPGAAGAVQPVGRSGHAVGRRRSGGRGGADRSRRCGRRPDRGRRRAGGHGLRRRDGMGPHAP